MVQEFSRQPNTDFVRWLLKITLMQIYNERKQVGQERNANAQFEKKKITRKYNVGVKAERDKEFKVCMS